TMRPSRTSSRSSPLTIPAASADVALDGADIARLCTVRILAELALGAPLAQQVPALIELLAEGLEAIGVLLRSGRGVRAQSLFLVDERGNAVENRLIVHGAAPGVADRARSEACRAAVASMPRRVWRKAD